MSRRFTSMLTHIVFSTKDRNPFLNRDLAPECRAHLGGIIENSGGRRIIVAGAEDRMHVLPDLPPA